MLNKFYGCDDDGLTIEAWFLKDLTIILKKQFVDNLRFFNIQPIRW